MIYSLCAMSHFTLLLLSAQIRKTLALGKRVHTTLEQLEVEMQVNTKLSAL